MKKNLIIAIDGYSSTGKSSMSKIIAKKLNYTHVDSGAMYRAVTWYALQNNSASQGQLNEERLIAQLPNIHISFIKNPTTLRNETYLNDVNVEDNIRSLEVSSMVKSCVGNTSCSRFLC